MKTIKEKLDQETLRHLQLIEELILSSMNGECNVSSPEELKRRFPILEGDIVFKELFNELQLLPAVLKTTFPHIKKVTLIGTVVDFMNEARLKTVFAQFHKLLRLYLTIPMSNATSERAFSTLRRLKTYLRTRLTQEHLNQFIILHAHKHLTDKININDIAKTFVASGESKRKGYFG